jgi:hypothetical protein
MTPLLIGIATCVAIAFVVLGLAVGLDSGEPAAEPSAIVMDYEWTHDMLFEPRRWPKRSPTSAADRPNNARFVDLAAELLPYDYALNPAPNGPAYNRPLDVEVPDGAILPPPRPINGVNNEA